MVAFVQNPDVTIHDIPPKGRGVIALRDFAPGEVVIVGRAVAVAPERTIYSVQVAMDKHILLDEPAVLTNHSCAPNTGVRNNSLGGYDFIALRPISTGEEVTWDYETTEYEVIAVPRCLCGSNECRGTLRGFRYNAAYLEQRYGTFLANYLAERAELVPRLQSAGIRSHRAPPHLESSSAIHRSAERERLLIGSIECQIQGDRTVVSAPVHVAGREFNVYFEASGCVAAPSYESFLAATLLPAMKLRLPIELSGPISTRLTEQIESIQGIFRVWRHDTYHPYRGVFTEVPVHAPPAEPLRRGSATGVGTFFSCGVDSFYTLLKHMDEITHLIYIRGFELPYGSDNAKLSDSIAASVHEVARAHGKSVIEVTTNIRQLSDEYISEQFHHGSLLAAVAHLLAPVISKVYVPSSQDYSQLQPWGSHPLLDHLWSTEAVEIATDGCDVLRLEKTERIARDAVALRHLRVCWEDEYNCGTCDKCIRTILSLQVLGALDKCPTFNRGPFTPEELLRMPPLDARYACYYHEIVEFLMGSAGDMRLATAVQDALSHKYYRGFGRILRGNVRGRMRGRLRGVVHSLLGRGVHAESIALR